MSYVDLLNKKKNWALNLRIPHSDAVPLSHRELCEKQN